MKIPDTPSQVLNAPSPVSNTPSQCRRHQVCQPKQQVRQPKQKVRPISIYAVLLRCNFCRKFTQFSGVQFTGQEMRWRTKNDKYQVWSGQFHTLAMVLKVFLVWRGAHAINSEEWSWQAPAEKWSQVSLSKGVRCRTAHRRVFWISSYFLWISSRFFLDFFHEKLCQVSLSKAVHCRTPHRRGAINDIYTRYFWIQTNIISTLEKYVLQNIFVWTAKCNCLICKMYLY